MNSLESPTSSQSRPRAVVTTPPLTAPLLRSPIGDGAIATALEWEGPGLLRFEVAADTPIPLRRLMPALQSMGLEVLHEHAGTWQGEDDGVRYVYDFLLEVGDATRAVIGRDSASFDRIRRTFHAVWDGVAEVDGFNALITATNLSWRQVSMLRSYARFCRQLPLPYSQTRIEEVLLRERDSAVALVDLFDARFDPNRTQPRESRTANAEAAVEAKIDAVVDIDADRILRVYRNLIKATVRTNAFVPQALTPQAPYLVHKIAATQVPEVPEPRPVSEIVVYAPTFEGLHLRFGTIARGGLRWSDRTDDYRTEVLGLARAQTVKNAMIVPAGAKGVFVVKRAAFTAGLDRAEVGQRCYRQFVSALLDVVDTEVAGGTVGECSDMVRYDDDDAYLVVAADKGTSTFSDLANSVAAERGYWMGDAFASGGSQGYDHKVLGITALGAWVSADSHLGQLGIDTAVDAFTVVGIGDMSGDVFGNGMLLRPTARLVAAFDHRHVFVDPHPRREAAAERQRLFDLARSSWDDFDRSVISAGGGVWPRSVKEIPISLEMAEALGLRPGVERATPAELIAHILRAPVDLLWNGGVGTYVKSADEQNSEVGDKVNDLLRVDAPDVRARAIAEGGNLGVTPRGRIAFARRGGLINTDAIDNAAGVDCSDHEVNIKTYLASAGLRAGVDRDELLAGMGTDVTHHVLRNNIAHNRLISEEYSVAGAQAEVHRRMVSDLERRRGLNRKLEHLPTDAHFVRLVAEESGLSRPELATLLGHVKLDLKADLDGDPVVADPSFAPLLQDYFPPAARAATQDGVSAHPLARHIVATSLVNDTVGSAGLSYVFRMAEETGATTADIMRAHAVVTAVFRLNRLWKNTHDADLPAGETTKLIVEGRRLLDRATRWFLIDRPQPLHVARETERFSAAMAELRPQLPALMGRTERATMHALTEKFLAGGAPSAAAAALGDALYAYSLLDIIESATEHDLDAARLAQVYFLLSERLGVDALLIAVSALPKAEQWAALARLQLREDLYGALRDLAVDIVRRSPAVSGGPIESVEAHERHNASLFARARRVLARVGAESDSRMGLPQLTVATAQLRSLVSSQSYGAAAAGIGQCDDAPR